MKDISSLFISPEASVIEAIEIIDKGGKQIALVIDSENHLLGIITDGDVRRSILKGSVLEKPVSEIMNTKFKFAYKNEKKESLLEIIKKESIKHIPILDKELRVIELILLDDIFSSLELTNKVVIMAGGRGSRLRPHTENCPKPMLRVGNKPMLEIVIEQCISYGIKEFYLSVNYLKDKVINYFEDGSKWNIKINYLIENKPLGTAGALQLLPDDIKEPFFVMNGDVLTRFDLRHLLQFHLENRANATLCAREHDIQVPFGVVETNGVDFVSINEKPTYSKLVNAGIYVLEANLLNLIPKNEFFDMPTLFQIAQEKSKKIVVCPIHEYWIDVGRPETLKKADNEWSSTG